MSTLTVSRIETRPNRSRGLSLSLRATSCPSLLLNIPAELTLIILELAIRECKPSTLAVVSKAISAYIDHIIYRTVVLNDLKTIHLFAWTTRRRSPSFMAEHVKSLAVTLTPEHYRRGSSSVISEIIAACTGVRKLAVPSCHHPISLPSVLTQHDGLSELTIQSYDEAQSSDFPVFTRSPTHLRICEPSDAWCSPLSMLESFGPLPDLRYLELSRRTNANEENDAIFVSEILRILDINPRLKTMVIRIFPQSWWSAEQVPDITGSTIWALMQSVVEHDSRVILLEGKYGEWKESAAQGVDYWAGLQQTDPGGSRPA